MAVIRGSEGTGILLGGFYSGPLNWSNWMQHARLCLKSFTLSFTVLVAVAGRWWWAAFPQNEDIKSFVQSKGVNRSECATPFFFLKCLKRRIKKWLKSFHVTPTEAWSPRRSGKIPLLWSNSRFSILNNSSMKKTPTTVDWLLSRPQSDVTGAECVAAVSGRVQGRSRSGSCPGRPNHSCCKIYGPSSSGSPGKGDSR